MATSILLNSLLLTVLCMAVGQSTISDDSHCSYMLKLPAAECGRTPVDEQFMKSSMIALQTQMKLLAGKQTEDNRKLTEENEKLRQKIASIEAATIRHTDENVELRQKITTMETGRNRSAVNLKQCSKRGINDYSEYGLVFSCEFVKKMDDTVLRVVWNGDIRLANNNHRDASCRRWFFTINGTECSDPRTIDTQLYVYNAAANDHRPAYVEGYCRGIAAGDVYVAWNVGDCVSQASYSVGDSYTAWVATVRIIVEEVDVENADTVIV